MDELTRADMQARYRLFDRFALKDQKAYYDSTVARYRKSATQVNRYRAGFAFLTGFSAAAAGLIVQTSFTDGAPCGALAQNPPGYCGALEIATGILAVLAIIFPVLGGAFSMLADLYQWDKLITIYEGALVNMEVADALSPTESMDDNTVYRASMRAFAEGALTVMNDETAQWGQSVRTPPQLEQFIEEERQKVARRQRRRNPPIGPESAGE